MLYSFKSAYCVTAFDLVACGNNKFNIELGLQDTVELDRRQ